MSNGVAVLGHHEVVRTDNSMTQDQIDLIKRTIAKGATDDELKIFLHACRRTGLDPLARQIHAVKRWDNKLGREVMSIQTGIDGYRLIADRTNRYAPGPKPTYEIDQLDGLLSATAYVKKQTPDGTWHIVEAEAFLSDYMQTTKDGQPTAMWRKDKMMLAKCAEALALRKAFPAELSGVYTHEEMMQADEAPRVQHGMDAKAKIAELMIEGIKPGEQTATAKVNALLQEEEASEDLPIADEPTLTASNVIQQFRLCESIAEWSQVANSWQEESHLHSDEDRASVKQAADLAKKRLGKK